MFGCPSILLTTPDTCKRGLTDDDAFEPGWPISAEALMGKKSFIVIPSEEHKRLRKITSAPVNGLEALTVYMKYIEANVKSALNMWTTMGEIEFLTELRRLTFRVIIQIFLSEEDEHVVKSLEREYTAFNGGIRAMAIDLPGFAYHKALRARKNLVAKFQEVVNERRKRRRENQPIVKKDMMDLLVDVQDENGRKLDDEEIIDILLMYLNAGHESSGHIIMWATILLQEHPEIFRKAKEEQEKILKNRPLTQEGLTLKEYRQMEYMSKVIDETLRFVNISWVVFRKAKTDVKMNGYLIPTGWRVLLWFRHVHMDPKNYPDPKEFDPSRWDGPPPKAGMFIPFGGGSHLCPGNDLAKLEIAIFLHHFLLGYKVERSNPKCPLRHLPHTRPMDNCLARIIKVENP
ncbi:Cytochrome P450 [Dillenia turbinata]|uniref:Cytochrome P450 n=1 Tax=Dillenia turbinata TaxID=194707 RepID=A0AAN8V2P3_9MAGN